MEYEIFLGYWDKLMVIGGYSAESKSEIIDLSGQNLNCPSVPDFSSQFGSVGTFLNDQAWVCGGYDGNNQTSDCFTYNAEVRNLKI